MAYCERLHKALNAAYLKRAPESCWERNLGCEALRSRASGLQRERNAGERAARARGARSSPPPTSH
eukprot:51777-Rhodomonas_salina.1